MHLHTLTRFLQQNLSRGKDFCLWELLSSTQNRLSTAVIKTLVDRFPGRYPWWPGKLGGEGNRWRRRTGSPVGPDRV